MKKFEFSHVENRSEIDDPSRLLIWAIYLEIFNRLLIDLDLLTVESDYGISRQNHFKTSHFQTE